MIGMNARYGFMALALMFLLPGVFASFAVSSYSISPEQVEPGEYGTLSVVITNTDQSYEAQSIKALIDTITSVRIEREVVVGDLAPGSSASLSIPFEVAPGTKTGIYPITLEIYGQVRQPNGNVATVNKVVFAALKIVNPPALQVSLERNEITETDTQQITILNNGGIAKKVYIRITSSGMGFLDQDVIYISAINRSATVPVRIDARNADEGPQKIELAISYEDELGNSYSESRSLPITVKKESGDFVFTQLSSITTGKEGKVKIEMANYGDDIQNLRFSLQDSSVQFVGLSEYKVGDVARGEKKVFEVPIIASVEPGTTPVKLELKWVEKGQSRESTKTVPLRVSSDADVGVYLEAKPAPLYTNSEHTISITVSNLGSYPIQATTVSLAGDGITLLSIQPEQYIG
ncbi:MAG: hypothetical protein N3H30_00665, partial [Candidatus Micrarchaeota archaeon]|nr:hypothetical protein [Candidatus Micrarchaeota archaeon]